MKTITRIVAIAIAVFTFSSCIQSSTVIRVKPDGSGSIFARYFFSPQMKGMMSGLAGGLGGLGGAEGVTVEGPDPSEIFEPSKESLEEGAASYGEGVRLSKHEKATNNEGWEGYLVVYDFDDINTVKFDPNNPPGPLKELENLNPDAAAEAKENISEDSTMAFAMKDGVLTINTGVSEDSIGKIAETGGADNMLGPDGKIPPEAAAQMAMAAGMMQGARMGVFLRVDGEIAETNAKHVNGTLITLSDVEMAKMMSDPKFIEFMNQALTAGDDADEATVKKMAESLDSIEGVTMETSEEITVKVK